MDGGGLIAIIHSLALVFSGDGRYGRGRWQ